jgi:hypothetical protein
MFALDTCKGHSAVNVRCAINAANTDFMVVPGSMSS